MTVEEILKRQEGAMGRHCVLLKAAEMPLEVTVVMYYCDSQPLGDGKTLRQFRVATYCGAREMTSSIAHTDWLTPEEARKL